MAKKKGLSLEESGELTFGMTKPSDWLAKAKRERHRYFTAWADTTAQADHAMNFAMTAWGLVQWVYRSNPELQIRYGDLRGFQEWVRQACPQMETMQTIGTVARHRQVTTYDPDTLAVTASATSTVEGDTTAVWKARSSRGQNRVLEEMDRILAFWDQRSAELGV